MRPPGRHRIRRGQQGLTLIETLCAGAILAVAIAGLSNLAAAAAALHQAAIQKAAALRAVEQEVAVIVATPIANIPATFDNSGFAVTLEGKAGDALKAPKNDADGLPGNVQVTAPTGDATALVEVVIRVDWLSPHGSQSVFRRLRLSRLGSA